MTTFKKVVASIHPTYKYWIRLKSGYYCDGFFCTDEYPLPKETGNTVIFELWVSPAVLYKADIVQAYVMLKKEIDRHIEAKKYKENAEATLKVSSVSNEVALDNKTTVTIASCTETKVSQKMSA